MMKRLAVSLAMVILAVGSARAAMPLQFPLKLVAAPAPGYGGHQRLAISLKPPKARYKMPKFVAARPLYASLKLGDKECLVVADFSTRNSGWYDRIYIDANGNRDLTDDKVLMAKPNQPPSKRDYKMSKFDVVEVSVVVTPCKHCMAE